MDATETDVSPFMNRALELAAQAQGLTSPNPPVGAVLVKDGRIVGQGRTQPAGGPHAEIVALRRAGEAARGATLYVTLEPCSHWGRTPPCADALVEAGIAVVHAAVVDPNPAVGGAGARRLSEHGIEVTVGNGAERASKLLEAHVAYVLTGKPFVTLFLSGPDYIFRRLVATHDVAMSDGEGIAHLPGPAHHLNDPPMLRLQSPLDATTLLDIRPPRAVGQPPSLATLPPTQADWSSLLSGLGAREVTSVLATGSRAFLESLMQEGIGDKVVIAEGEQPPPGFPREGRRTAFGGWNTFYRDAPSLRS